MGKITERIDRITLLTDELRSLEPPVPRSVKIELTDREFFRRVLKQMRALGVEEIGLSYLAESFLCRWLPEAVRYAKQDCGYPYVFLTTNGRMATAERVRECMAAGLDTLEFNFNFSDEFAKVVANLQAARRVRDEVEAATGQRCGLYASGIGYLDGQQAAGVAEILPYVDGHYWLPLYGRIGALRKLLPCWSLFTEGHITCDGRLSACCLDHDGRFDMGDLHYETFLEAWHSERFQKLRRANLAGDVRGTLCEQCVASSS